MSEPPPQSTITSTFERLRSAGRTAFIPFITAGHPAAEEPVGVLEMLADEGADIIELGIPFSDPLADGPTIQRASWAALGRGVSTRSVLSWTAEFTRRCATPVVFFSYLNPILKYGAEEFSRDAAGAGAAGLLVTDLPLGVDQELERKLASGGLDLVRLVAPTTPPERAARIASAGGGFIYYISRTGVTGERDRVRDELAREVTALRSVTSLPIAVGFGIASAQQARAVAGFADGVVVGSALVKALEEGGIEGARALARELATAVHASDQQ